MDLRRCTAALCAAGLFALPALGAVRVENPSGSITVRVERRDKVDIRHTTRGRESLPGDIRVEGTAGDIVVRAQPSDSATVDIDLALPYGVHLEASTTTGSISFTGVIVRARFDAGDGNIRVTAPWTMTRLVAASREEPRSFLHPGTLRGRRSSVRGHWGWVSQQSSLICCEIEISGRRPASVELVDMPLPPDSAVKPHEQAKPVLDAILGGRLMAKARTPDRSAEPYPPALAQERDGEPVFLSNVRLVNLAVAVNDRDGHPAAGLGPDDFEVLEEGVHQELASAATGEAEFNLASLFDFSLSTTGTRTFMEEARRRIMGVARPQDRLAFYALAYNFLFVGSWLSKEHRNTEDWIGLWEQISGGTPLYDVIVLACAEELLRRPNERNALIIISDGLDNQLTVGGGSTVSFGNLRRAAQEMPILLYTLYLPSSSGGTVKSRATALDRMQALADASGGRLFTVKTIEDLKPVAAQVAEDLRSVYTLAYYPKNQNFDGRWRKIEVRVKRPDVKFRTRPGYYAR